MQAPCVARPRARQLGPAGNINCTQAADPADAEENIVSSDAGNAEQTDDGGGVTPEPELILGPTAQCLPDLCVDVDCDDGNPCTEDLCDSRTGICSTEELNSQQLCLTGEAQCDEGRCIQGECVSFDGRACTRQNEACSLGKCTNAECVADPDQEGANCMVDVSSLCEGETVGGTCSIAGECIPNDDGQDEACDNQPCNGICIRCVIIPNILVAEYCLEF